MKLRKYHSLETLFLLSVLFLLGTGYVLRVQKDPTDLQYSPFLKAIDQYQNVVLQTKNYETLEFTYELYSHLMKNRHLQQEFVTADAIKRKFLHFSLTKNSLGACAISKDSSIGIYFTKRASIDVNFPAFQLLKTYVITADEEEVSKCAVSQDLSRIAFSKYASYSGGSYHGYLQTFSVEDNNGVLSLGNEVMIDSNDDNIHKYQISSDGGYIAFLDTKSATEYTVKVRNVGGGNDLDLGDTQIPSMYMNTFKDNLIVAYTGLDGSQQLCVSAFHVNSDTLLISQSIVPEGITEQHSLYISDDGKYVILYDKSRIVVGKLENGGSSWTINWSQVIPFVKAQIYYPYELLNKFIVTDGPDKKYYIPAFSYESEYTEAPLEPDCSLDLGSTSSSLNLYECQCRINYFWDSLQLKCLPQCKTNFASSANPENQMECLCQAGSVWNPVFNLCVVDCENTRYATGQWLTPQICKCFDTCEWNPRTFECTPKCQIQTYATGVYIDKYQCECIEGKGIWNVNKGVCVRDCSVIEFTRYPRPDIDGNCICLDNYYWMNGKCEFSFSCADIDYTNSEVEQTGQGSGECICVDGFNWDNQTKICKVDCVAVSEKNQLTIGVRTTPHSCQCVDDPQAFWSFQAVECFLDCSVVLNSSGTNINAETCQCDQYYKWNENSNTCDLDCGSRPGEKTQLNDDKTHCQCLTDFIFYENSVEGGACYRNCDLYDNTVNLFGNTPNTCSCQPGFQWEQSSTVCQILCSSPYDDQPATTTTCNCIGAAIFVSAYGKCLPICRNDPLSDGKFNTDSYACNCVANAIWNRNEVRCKCKVGYEVGSNGQSCNIITSSIVIPVAIGGAVCSGGSVLAAMIIRQKKKQNQASKRAENQKPATSYDSKLKTITQKSNENEYVV